MYRRLILICSLSFVFLCSCERITILNEDKSGNSVSTEEMAFDKIPLASSVFNVIQTLAQANQIASEELETSSEEVSEDEKIEISNTFYISALIIIVIAGYLMNKRKPLLNQ